MGINAIILALLTAAIAVHAMYVYQSQETPPDKLPWTPIESGKTRSFHSQTRDASMYTERARRVAIISNPRISPLDKSSTNGSLEANFLSGIIFRREPPKICPPPEYVADGGGAGSDVCDILDGSGTDVLDFGDSGANVCDV
jgi:hypothetical protein